MQKLFDEIDTFLTEFIQRQRVRMHAKPYDKPHPASIGRHFDWAENRKRWDDVCLAVLRTFDAGSTIYVETERRLLAAGIAADKLHDADENNSPANTRQRLIEELEAATLSIKRWALDLVHRGITSVLPVAASDSSESRISVDLDRYTATLKSPSQPAREFQVKSVQALRWLKVLVERDGEWISGPSLNDVDDELDGVRTHKLKPLLPTEINAMIESDKSRGSRLCLP